MNRCAGATRYPVGCPVVVAHVGEPPLSGVVIRWNPATPAGDPPSALVRLHEPAPDVHTNAGDTEIGAGFDELGPDASTGDRVIVVDVGTATTGTIARFGCDPYGYRTIHVDTDTGPIVCSPSDVYPVATGAPSYPVGCSVILSYPDAPHRTGVVTGWTSDGRATVRTDTDTGEHDPRYLGHNHAIGARVNVRIAGVCASGRVVAFEEEVHGFPTWRIDTDEPNALSAHRRDDGTLWALTHETQPIRS